MLRKYPLGFEPSGVFASFGVHPLRTRATRLSDNRAASREYRNIYSVAQQGPPPMAAEVKVVGGQPPPGVATKSEGKMHNEAQEEAVLTELEESVKEHAQASKKSHKKTHEYLEEICDKLREDVKRSSEIKA